MTSDRLLSSSLGHIDLPVGSVVRSDDGALASCHHYRVDPYVLGLSLKESALPTPADNLPQEVRLCTPSIIVSIIPDSSKEKNVNGVIPSSAEIFGLFPVGP